MKSTLVLISLAQNQSRFYGALEPLLAEQGHRVVHVCFHEGGVAELEAAGSRVFNPFTFPLPDDSGTFADFGVLQPELLIAHEKAAYGLRDSQVIVEKFQRHLATMSSILLDLIEQGHKPIIVQELGGFTSVLAVYYAARRHGLDNYFLEPSFFKGRFMMSRNTFASPAIRRVAEAVSSEIRARLEGIRASQTVVIPTKDKSHYRGAMKKIIDRRNIRRFGEKLYDKYVLKRQEEFQHLGGHIARHVGMAINSARSRRYYSQIPVASPFIYYPLHVPADFALTIRAPEYLDQLALIDYLCRIAPLGHQVVIKEHPALVGAVSSASLNALMRRHDNLVLLDPTINNHKVLQQATAVVTVNSKAGAEALLHGKPVFNLGDSFYRHSGLVVPINALSELPGSLRSPLMPDDEAVNRFFEDVWQTSRAGELYDASPENLVAFADSILKGT